MARGKGHSEETKAAVMAALLSGQGIEETAQAYKLPESTIRSWREKWASEGKFAEVRAKKGDQIEGLVFDYLTANFEALKSQANVAADQTYLKRFPPQQLAVLHGVMADKAFRLLEALSGAEAERPPDSAE